MATSLEDTQVIVNGSFGQERPETHSAELFSILETLNESKRFLILTITMGTALAGLVAWLLPARYTATAVIMPPQRPQSLAASLFGQLGALSSLGGRDLGLKTPGDLYIGLLASQTIADEISARFKLRQLYRTTNTIDTRAKLAKRTRFTSGKDSLIHVSVDDSDPDRAAALANAYVDELNGENAHLAITESSQRRLFFERQVSAEKDDLARAEAAFRKLQESSGMLQAGTQFEVMMRATARLQSEIANREVLLSRLRMAATDSNPQVLGEQAELAALRGELRKVQSGTVHSAAGETPISAAELPAATLEYARRLRDLKYHEALYEALSKQYEASRLDEAQEANVIQVVDRAAVPDKKSWPPRAQLTLLGGLLSALLSGTFVFALRGIQRRREVHA